MFEEFTITNLFGLELIIILIFTITNGRSISKDKNTLKIFTMIIICQNT